MLPAISQPGITIVILPILALICDQMERCQKKQIPVATLYGGLPEAHKQQLLHDLSLPTCVFKLLYITPEFLVEDTVLHNILKSLLQTRQIQQFVIDECHCVSLWGKEFRPAYLKLSFLREEYPCVPIVMLTATATVDVQQDVCAVLSVAEPVIIKDKYDKPNLRYIVNYKDNKLCDSIVQEIKCCDCSIVYGTTRTECENMSAKLCAQGINAKAYHGDMSKTLKDELFQKWKSGQLKCLVSTKAFGMGVDKPNVRVVIHMSMPNSMEDYYQETGKGGGGGRDGLPCKCILYFSPADAIKHIQAIYRQHYDTPAVLNSRYNHLQKFFYFCFQHDVCRRR